MSVQHIAMDADFIYFLEGGAYPNMSIALKKVPLNGGTPVTLASDLYLPSKILVRNGFIYYSSGGGALYKISAQGGSPTPISCCFSTPPGDILIDVDNIYIAENTSTGTVKRISINASPIDKPVIVGDYHGAGRLAVDNVYIYWTEPSTGKIQRAPK